jgi:hypothetical protein
MRPGEPLSGRLVGGARRGPGGLEATSAAEALATAADLFARRPAPVVIASPFVTQDEGAAIAAAAARLGATPRFVSPAPNGLADDLLHTGDPCPNRRGLTELGFAPATPAEVAVLLAGAECALLAGERVAELVGLEALAALPAGLRLVLFDTHARDLPALDAAVAVPTHVEKTGRWLNVDGLVRELGRAKAPPAGVEPLERTLARLVELARGPSAQVQLKQSGARA